MHDVVLFSVKLDINIIRFVFQLQFSIQINYLGSEIDKRDGFDSELSYALT